jgi:uncharacterized protein YgiM (DUF1202 family)
MALAIAVCFGGFTWLYVQLDPWVRDFAGVESAPSPTPRSQASNDESDDDGEQTDEDEDEAEPEPTNTPDTEDNQEIEEADDEDSGGFDPDYQVIALEQVNLRSGPGVDSAIVTQVNPGDPLEFLGNREASSNPDADGDSEWLNFETEEGQEGWIRQIDVGET